jgi:hypothetical protein
MVKKKSYFVDLDTLLIVKNEAWVVNKNNPTIPIKKISKTDFNLIRSGIYRSQDNKIQFNGNTYWLPTKLYNEIKVKCKSNKIDVSDLAISLQEFFNKSVIDHLDFDLNMEMVNLLKNKTDDIYIICSRQTKKNYSTLIEKLNEILHKNGISIKSYYYISDNFYNQNYNDTKLKKIKLLIQHLIGYRTEGDKFIDTEITRYRKILFFDNELDTLEITRQVNYTLEVLLTKTENGLRDIVKEDVVEFRPELVITKVNENELNKFTKVKVILNITRIKTFESFSTKR